jgi:hypothetical protein
VLVGRRVGADEDRAPQAMLLVEFSGDDRDRLLGQLARWSN